VKELEIKPEFAAGSRKLYCFVNDTGVYGAIALVAVKELEIFTNAD
jgi:hypothetical protein